MSDHLRNRPRINVTLPGFMVEWLRGRVESRESPTISDEVEKAVAAWMMMNKRESPAEVVHLAWQGDA